MKKFAVWLLLPMSIILLIITLVVLAIYNAGYHPKHEVKLPIIKGNWTTEDTDRITEEKLKVLFFNINHGLGMEAPWYEDAQAEPVIYSPDAIKLHLDLFVAYAAKVSPDFIIINEIDFGSQATAMLDQAVYIAQALNMPYLVRVPDQRSPFPIYPAPFQGRFSGPLDSGAAFLSHYPIVDAILTPLPKAIDRHWTVDAFGPIAYAADVRMRLPDGRMAKLVHVKLDPWHAQSRQYQAREAGDWIAQRDHHDMAVFLSAYTSPQARPKTLEEAEQAGFLEYTLDLFRQDRRLKEIVSDYQYLKNPEEFMNILDAHGNLSGFWNRVFLGPGLSEPQLITDRQSGVVSTHLPLVLEFMLPHQESMEDEATDN